MNILCFDTSSENIYIALIMGDKSEKYFLPNTPSTEYLLPEIDKVLKANSISIKDIDVIAVGAGPGSFTGSRVAIVTAKAFASVYNNIKILPFSAFDAIGYKNNHEDMYVIKGFSDFVYVAYEDKFLCVTKDDAKVIADCKEHIYGVSDILSSPKYVSVEYDIIRAVKNKLAGYNYVKINELEPIYLRASQAELQLLEKQKKR